MKANLKTRRVPTRFNRLTRFKIQPRFAPLTDDQAQRAFEKLKSRLLEPVLDEAVDPILRRQLQHAANEAAAVAWQTPFPLLILPVLLEEKAAEAELYALRQEQVESMTQQLLVETAS